jgi:hypothetical protein
MTGYEQQGTDETISPYERYNPADPATIVPDDAIRTTQTGRRRAVDCRECDYWFLGCLRGRAKWHDTPIMPNRRYFTNGLDQEASRCDAFTWDHDEDRQGRCVVP